MEEIYNQQIEFQENLGNDVTSQDFKNQMAMGLIEETIELLKETPFKRHKKNQKFNREAFLEECADAQLYLLNLVISADASMDEFKLMLEQKQKINIERQQNDY